MSIEVTDTRVDLDKYSHRSFARKYNAALDEFVAVTQRHRRDSMLELANYAELDGRPRRADALRRAALNL